MSVSLRPVHWRGFFDGWEVWDGLDYLGLVGEYDEPLRYRAYGVRLGVDGEPVALEYESGSKDEAVAWLEVEA